MKRRLRLALPFALLLVSAWMSYDNVLRDLGPIQAQAERAACGVEKCTEQHGVTKVSRTPFGVSFELTWRVGMVDVDCHRSFYVAGARGCSAQKR